jgi:hypothetical protein
MQRVSEAVITVLGHRDEIHREVIEIDHRRSDDTDRRADILADRGAIVVEEDAPRQGHAVRTGVIAPERVGVGAIGVEGVHEVLGRGHKDDTGRSPRGDLQRDEERLCVDAAAHGILPQLAKGAALEARVIEKGFVCVGAGSLRIEVVGRDGDVQAERLANGVRRRAHERRDQ